MDNGRITARINPEPAGNVVRSQSMLKRALLSYVLTEIAVAALLIWAVGLGWTFVILAVTFMAGVVLAGSQVTQLRRIGLGSRAADGAMIGLGTALVFLPGLVTTVAGALMLTPMTRAAMRPAAAALLTRGLTRGLAQRITVADLVTNLPRTNPRRTDYIDGEVVGETLRNAVALRR